MRNSLYPIRLTSLAALMLIALGPIQPVKADAAPPWYAQGASLETSESITHVQMVSEQVLLVVEKQDTVPEDVWLTAASTTGRVEAIFVMLNQGTTEESFDVWFPLGTSDGYIENFAVWVNGAPVATNREQTRDKWDRLVSWATWPVTFPPEQPVDLRVTYDVLLVGYHPYGQFRYTLETGAGWWGPIGEGTVTIRLPYEVNESNTLLHLHQEGRGTCLPNPAAFTISGTDVVWHLSNLEPTEDDNICLTVLSPSMWEKITAAQGAVAAAPDSPEAHLRLARALVDVLWFEKGGGLARVGNNVGFAELTEASFKRALELAPEDVEIYVQYLELLRSLTCSLGPLPENLIPTLERAVELAPDDERLLEMRDWIAQEQSHREAPTPTAAPPSVPSTATPIPMPTSTSTPTFTPTPAPTHASTPTPKPMPTDAHTISPVSTSTPIPTPTTSTVARTPTSEPDNGGPVCQGTSVAALLPVAAFWVERARRRKRI